MRFEKAVNRLFDYNIAADPALCPDYLRKVDIKYAYMHIWVQAEYGPSSAFLIPKETED